MILANIGSLTIGQITLKKTTSNIGVVIIGRNEGERLVRCLSSIPKNMPMIYVDSGSTDNSVNAAISLGAISVQIDPKQPFTAARARNLGWKKLLSLYSDIEFIQFIDGDCYFDDTWFDAAKKYLSENSRYAVCCGRRQEINPEASIYNALCDIEWNTPSGDAKSCGGDALIRATAIQAVGGYRDDLIAGEEPEMCLRLADKGYKIRRIDCAMTWHDAAIFTFSQWWRRSMRCGFAYANGAALHGKAPQKHWVKETYRALFWGGLIPVVILIITTIDARGLLLLAIYPVLMLKIYIGAKIADKNKLQWSFFMVVSKFSECLGIAKYFLSQVLNRRSKIIEYK